MKKLFIIFLSFIIFIGLIIGMVLIANEAEKYTISEILFQENEVSIKYPQIENFKDKEKQDYLNRIIKKTAFRTLDPNEPDFENICMQIDYEISYEKNNLLTIIFSGSYSDKDTSDSFLLTVNLDTKAGKKLILSDIIEIDDRLIKQLRDYVSDNFPDDISFYPLNQYLHEKAYTELIADLQTTGNSLDYDFCLSKNSLKLKFNFNHSERDYVLVEFPFDSIKDLIKSEYKKLLN